MIDIRFGILGQLLPDVSLIETVAIVDSLSIIDLTSLAVATRAQCESAPIIEFGSRQ